MKKYFKLVLSLGALFIGALVLNVFAADLQYATNGWDKVGQVDVQIRQSDFTLDKAISQNGVTLPSGFKVVQIKKYTADEYENGTYDSERDTKLSYSSFLTQNAVVYETPLSVGKHNISGEINFLIKNGAITSDRELCDVHIKVDNIIIEVGRETTKPVLVLTNVFALNSYYAQQEVPASELKSNNKFSYTNIGSSYDVTVYITKAGTDEKIHKNMGLSFIDLDQADIINNGRMDDDGNPFPYAEKITLISGITDTIHLIENHKLNITDSIYGKNTVYNGIESSNQKYNTGFITLVDTDGFKFRWTGSTCATGIGLLTTSLVETSTSGDYKDKVTITEPDNEILWKEDKSILITPDKGYYVDKITVDGEEVDLTTITPKADGSIVYTFNSVIEDHTIDVSVNKKPNYKLHYDANGGEGTMKDTEAEYDVKSILSKNTFTKEGYVFSGWKAVVDGKEVTFKDEAEFINLINITGKEVTLLAQWKTLENPATGLTLPLAIFSVIIISAASAIYLRKNNYFKKV